MNRIAGFLLSVVLLHQAVFADPAESMLPESFSGQLRGTVSQFMEFERDDHSLLVLKRSVLFGRDGKPAAERNYGAAGALAGETRFVYTKNALLSEIRGTDATGRLTWRYAYAYDELGRTISESAFDSSGNLEGRVSYSYDDSGLLVKTARFDKDGTVSLQDTFQYDGASRLIARLTLYSDGKLLKRVMNFFDAQGRKAVEERYDANGLYEREEYAYGTDGYLAAVKTFAADGALKRRVKRVNGSDGRILEESVFGPDGTLVSRTEYQYDETGNWVSRHKTDGSIAFREYIYAE